MLTLRDHGGPTPRGGSPPGLLPARALRVRRPPPPGPPPPRALPPRLPPGRGTRVRRPRPPGPAPPAGRGRRLGPAPPRGHHGVPARRAEPPRHLRHEAGRGRRGARPVQPHPDERAG